MQNTQKSDHDLLTEIHGVLLGTNGQGGLCREVRNHNDRITRLELVVAFLIGSGAIAGGALGVIRWLGG